VRRLRDAGLRAPDDPTVHGARTVPIHLDAGHAWGTSPGGGTRTIVAGERIVAWGDGSLAAAADRLPAAPSSVTDLPERLGGGVLYAIGNRLWWSDGWLGRAAPVLTLSGPVTSVFVGLDRVYVRAAAGLLSAFDPRARAVVGLGPLPPSPALGRIAALDAWRAVATADLRGALVTLDAGATWRPLDLPIDAADVVLTGDGIAVGGLDANRQASWWEVRPDGQVGRLGGAPGAHGADDHGARAAPAAAHVLGARPLVAAIEDGWPLTDGTAAVARDGTLSRVRLADGAIVESVADAYPMRPSRCHPVSLARAADPGAFGFVCGEPRGRTRVYRFDGKCARLVEMRRFDGPRAVLASDNGGLAVKGPCAADAPGETTGGDVAYCLLPPGGAWTEMHFRGDDVDRARLVVLSDGRAALVRPPRDADLSTIRLTLTDGAKSTHVAVTMPALRGDVAHALRTGLWLDGFEERRPGVVGGWIDASGSAVGVEIALDGAATVGEYHRAASDVFVSGRYGLAWAASRHGIETTDGGITWKDVDLPEPLQPARAVEERACGPVGCLAAGWMRVGWGQEEVVAPKDPTARASVASRSPPPIDLRCEALSGKAPDPPAAVAIRRAPPTLRAQPPRMTMMMGAGVLTLGASQGSTDLGGFLGHAGPALHDDEAGLGVDVFGSAHSTYGAVPSGRIDAWGPKTGDWDQLGRWRIDWVGPFGGWPDVRRSAVAQAPWTSFEAARRGTQIGGGGVAMWSILGGDDDDHALLVGRHVSGFPTAEVLELESDRAPIDVRRPGGELLPDVEAAVRVGARWYVATTQPAGELAATVVWLLDGAQAREIARLPRLPGDPRAPLRLARRADGRALGVVVDGEGVVERAPATRWVSSVDLETGAVGEPVPLAPVDLADRAVATCTGDDGGWQVDLPYPGRITLAASSKTQSVLQQPLARVRLSSQGVCVERLAGTLPSLANDHPWLRSRLLARAAGGATGAGAATEGKVEVRTIDVGVSSARMRYSLRCTRM
jgi:hypothetical protein